ncbi:hypothetical protein Maes01_02774 [Microbulbifer aestuariivivens]|uniref:DUF4381 domain-containing protein n=1 Tax=Microbulbifer aestuariivivens TaxID=1908308 RepID=A0ABP9WSY2_9GAMM
MGAESDLKYLKKSKLSLTIDSEKEARCIDASRALRISAIDKKIKELSYVSNRYESPLAGVSLRMPAVQGTVQRLKIFALLPVVIVLLAFLAMLVPVCYAACWLECRKDIRSLKKKKKSLLESMGEGDAVGIKTLEALWCEHGVGRDDATLDGRIRLIDEWIEILYGKDCSMNVDFPRVVERVQAENAGANRPYYDGVEGAPHFYFGCPVEQAVDQVSELLPLYR